jgi:hypothetical protein
MDGTSSHCKMGSGHERIQSWVLSLFNCDYAGIVAEIWEEELISETSMSSLITCFFVRGIVNSSVFLSSKSWVYDTLKVSDGKGFELF